MIKDSICSRYQKYTKTVETKSPKQRLVTKGFRIYACKLVSDSIGIGPTIVVAEVKKTAPK